MVRNFTFIKNGSKQQLEMEAQWGFVATSQGCVPANFAGELSETQDATLDKLETGIDVAEIEIGLRESGRLMASMQVEIPTAMCPGTNGEGQAAVHRWDDAFDSGKITKSIVELLNKAIANQATAGGMLCHPAKMRYALRLKKGGYAWASPEIQLLPSPQIPCVSIGSLQDLGDGKTLMTVNLSMVSMHKIYWRLAQELSMVTVGEGEAIDFFIAEPVKTYSTDDFAEGRITKYRNVVASSPARRMFADSNSGGIFKGCYAPNGTGDAFADQYFSEIELAEQVWALSPNPNFLSQFNGESQYYHVASVPVAELSAMHGFQELPLMRLDLCELQKQTQLQIDANLGIRMRGGVVARCSGRLFAAPSQIGVLSNGEIQWRDAIGTIYVSLAGNDRVFPVSGVTHIFDDEILALTPIGRSISQGQAGQFVLYALTAKGLWALAFDRSGACTSMQQIAGSLSVTEQAICTTDAGLAYLSGNVLTMVEGSKVQQKLLPDHKALVTSLPRFAEIAAAAGFVLPGWLDFAECKLLYNHLYRMIEIRDSQTNLSMAYSLDHDQWIMGICEQDAVGCLITAPFELGEDLGLASVREAYVNGAFASHAVAIAFYGSVDGMRWRLLSTSATSCLHAIGGTPYRLFRVVMFVDGSSAKYLTGISIVYQMRQMLKI